VAIALDFRLFSFSATPATTCDLGSSLLPYMALGIPREGLEIHTSCCVGCQRSLSVSKANISTLGKSDPVR
jgi:hypothetical protein